MKRFLMHGLFWLCYYLLYAYMNFLWDKSIFTDWSINHLLKVSVAASSFDLIPQMIFSYYLIYYGTYNIIRKNGLLVINIIEIASVFFMCTIGIRCFTNYIELPYLYKSSKLIPPLFEIPRILGAALYIGFASGLIFIIKSVKSQLNAKEREKNLIKEKLETELKFLRNQTNPHFLLNTLNNIYGLTIEKSDDAPAALMRLSELLRFMLYESNSNLIKLIDEIKILEDYLALETMRYSERLIVTFEKKIENDDYKITPLLLLPFIENAFKHGISETRFESFIDISISIQNGVLSFIIENSKDMNECNKSIINIGLNNVKRQLELTYSEYSLDIKNGDNQFKVVLNVNLNSYVEI